LELGSCLSVFSLPYDSWHFLATDCWLKTLWVFLDSAQLQLHSEEPLIPLPPRLHDGSIMADALLAGLPRPSIEAINRCRIVHQALYWSDVANGWGDSISPAMLRPPTSGRHRDLAPSDTLLLRLGYLDCLPEGFPAYRKWVFSHALGSVDPQYPPLGLRPVSLDHTVSLHSRPRTILVTVHPNVHPQLPDYENFPLSTHYSFPSPY